MPQPSDVVTISVTALPKTTLTVKPNPAYTGETVTLMCSVTYDSRWNYQRYKDWNYNVVSQSVRHTRTGDTLTISRAAESDQGQYWCEGNRKSRPTSSQPSDPVTLTVEALPKTTLTVKPNPAYTGETVTLMCSVTYDSRWNYQRYKDWNYNVVSQSVRHTRTGDTLTISRAAESDQGQYWCEGNRKSRPTSSQPSDPVTLTVEALPTASVKIVTPQGLLYPGETVTLQCDISDYTDWTYRWFRYNEELPIQTRKTTISLPDQADQYSCVGMRKGWPQKSYHSSALPIIITALPKTTLTVEPNPAYTGEKVTLKCSVESDSIWSYKWYKDRNYNVVSQSVRHTITGDTHTISRAAESDQGQYWCEGNRVSRPTSSQPSDHVTLTVKAGDVILESPVHPVTEGDSVTLTCTFRHQGTNPKPKTDFYKDGTLIKNETTGEMTIPAVSKSDEGFYTCKSGEGESPERWVPVRVPPGSVVSISLTRLLCGLLVVSPFLLVSIVLTVKCCRARGLCSTVKSPQDQIPCDDVIEQNESSV
ncbi:leukocyte immunoglobulin-like receptor subfamily A member 4 [Oncorhynchus clarkii lewisi]|uniref:leukocyte immunoglobulin-like receptor subfamily A member 4 n=1 Tax=Oncorhynchus clarkii lewisi TaxID=490388 RepID=UPI0039B8C175